MHHSVASQGGLKLLVAACAIETGEEIAHSYVSLDGECKLASRGQKIGPFLKRTWGFDCTCTACKDDALRAKLDRMLELSIAIVACTVSDVRLPDAPSKFDMAISQAEELIVLFDALGSSPHHYGALSHARTADQHVHAMPCATKPAVAAPNERSTLYLRARLTSHRKPLPSQLPRFQRARTMTSSSSESPEPRPFPRLESTFSWHGRTSSSSLANQPSATQLRVWSNSSTRPRRIMPT